MDGSTAARSGPAIDLSSAFMLLVTILAFFLPLLIYFPPFPPSKRDALLETHTQIGLAPSESGLRGSQASTVTGGAGHQSTIRSLWVYPIKSCKGIELRQSKVLATGLEYDRLYTFAVQRSPPSAGRDEKSTSSE